MKTLNFLSRKVILLVMALMLAYQCLPGQQPAGQENWLYYTSENTGIPGTAIYSAYVDYYNNVWVITNGGLVRFDGAVWTSYGFYVPGKKISALAFDNYGKMWVATSDGALTRYNGGSEEVMIEPGSGMFDGYISNIAFDSNNDIWFSTVFYLDDEEYSWFGCEESKLVKVEGLSVADDPEWTFFDNPELVSFFVSEMAFDANGNLWLGYSKGTLVKFDGSQFTEYNIFSYSWSGSHISFTIDQNNIIWAGDENATLIRFNGTNTQVIEPGYPDTGQPPFDYHEFKRLAVDENNNLWIGTDVGMIKYNGNSWFYYELETGIRSFDFESDGSVWAAGLYGLYVLRTGDDPELYGSAGFKITYYGLDNTGLHDDYISAIQTDSKGNSWIGMFDNGLTKFDGASWTTFQAADSDLPGNEVRTLTKDDDDNIWIGTRNGLAKLPAISLEGQSWPVYTTGNSGLPVNSVSCLHYANDNLWVGTALGLARFHEQIWATFNSDNSSLPHNDIRCIVTDPDGNIWIGTYAGGLCKIAALSLNEPEWEIFNTDNSALPDNAVFALEADSDGNIWIGTAYNGLAKYNGTDFTVYNTDNSDLPDDHIESLKLDDEDNIWIGMRYGGVTKFDGTEWTNHGTVLEGAVYTIDVDRYGNKWIGFAGGGVAVYNETGIASRNDLYLSGHLFLNGGDTPLEESTVELYPLDSTNYSEQLILSGNNKYEFTELSYGLYTVKVIPDTLSYPETLPTWLGYKLARAYASYITLSSNITGKDITVVQRPPAGSGTGTLSGSLFEENIGKKTTAVKLSGKKGTPVGDCFVYLLDPGDQSVKAFDITSSEGEFVFSNLEQGNYMFYTDYNSMPMDVSNPLLEISSTNDTLVISALAGEYVIGIAVDVSTGIETLLQRNLKVYPVPVRDHLIVDFENNIAAMNIQNISVVNLGGQVMYYRDLTSWSGSQIIIDMKRFSPGMYLLKIQGKDACHFVNLIKN